VNPGSTTVDERSFSRCAGAVSQGSRVVEKEHASQIAGLLGKYAMAALVGLAALNAGDLELLEGLPVFRLPFRPPVGRTAEKNTRC
jgi:hypothetical protein